MPSQNIVYADIDGNIGYQVPGLTPIRQNGRGQVPAPGWSGEYEWQGWVPFEEMPALFNPEQGYIATANHAIVDEFYPHYLDRDWAPGDRGQRIVDMIEAKIGDGGQITADDYASIQFDSKSLLAESYLPLLTDLSSDDVAVQEAVEQLRNWDSQERQDSVPAALFEIFLLHLIDNVLLDDIGTENLDLLSNSGLLIFLHDLATQPESQWWDDVNTPATETPEDILLQSLTEAINWLEINQEGGMDEWVWGNLHTITFEDSILGASGVAAIEAIFNRGPFPVDGGRAIVNANSWGSGDPAAVRGNPSMRMIVDMSDFDASQGIHPTGQSGHPYNPHYDDMMPLWLTGQYHPMPFSRELVEAAAVDHLVLRPSQ